MKQTQGEKANYRISISIDPVTHEMMDSYQEFVKTVLGMNVSLSVLARVGIREIYLAALAEVVKDQTARKKWSKEKRMEALIEFHDRNRRKLMKAAKGE